ncbi:ABC transporter substrate-binding protein [Aneurinibacillus terranovensis]|uniref:ABC transporter substrate-binding protein n=1 Tax=Aneurinibacillus terranovensis TaxID=278991 RepID=UPI0004832E31|nr:extracellular solute-binding protein [Aneurinibacillus terranovensis]
MNRLVQIGSITTMVAMLATGCSASANGKAATNDSSSKGDKELVFYSAEAFDKDIAQAFEKKTGIKVKLVDDSTGPLLARMQAEKSNPQWDVAWFDGPSSMQGLDNQNMLYKDYIPSNSSNYSELGKKMMPKDHAYFPASVTAAGAIAYNTKFVKDSEAPKDWSDLLKPEYKGSFAMNNPSISGPTYTTVLGLMELQGGIPQGQDFFTKLKANGLRVYDSNGPTLTNLIKGNVKFAIAQDSAIIDKIKKNAPVKIIYPKSGVTTLSSNIAIDAKAPHLEAAKKFVDFALSAEGQKVASSIDDGDANFESIIQGAPGKQGIRPDGIKWNTEDPVFGAQHENEIKQWFTQNIVQK